MESFQQAESFHGCARLLYRTINSPISCGISQNSAVIFQKALRGILNYLGTTMVNDNMVPGGPSAAGPGPGPAPAPPLPAVRRWLGGEGGLVTLGPGVGA